MARWNNVQELPVRKASWRGRSGRVYPLTPLSLREFSLADSQLHLVTLGPQVLWAGSARDIVQDAQSRARFRLALDCADRAYLAGECPDEIDRLTMIWDLEGAQPASDVAAA